MTMPGIEVRQVTGLAGNAPPYVRNLVRLTYALGLAAQALDVLEPGGRALLRRALERVE